MKGHTTFSVVGFHPALYAVRDRLILSGYALVQEQPDFLLVGAQAASEEEAIKLLANLGEIPSPTICLSTGSVYCDRALDLTVLPKLPMQETSPILIPSSLDKSAWKILYPICVESLLLRQTRTLVLRTFNLYGESIPGVIDSFVKASLAKSPLTIHLPGYQTRTFLHINDFLSCIDLVMPRFLSGARGIYNVGSAEEVTIHRLADSIWQLANGNTPVPKLETPPAGRSSWWRLPDTNRIQAWTRWRPSTTVRRGVWNLLKAAS